MPLKSRQPALADLLPDCVNYERNMTSNKDQSSSTIWEGICVHAIPMTIAVSLCFSGFYYYENAYIPPTKVGVPNEKNIPTLNTENNRVLQTMEEHQFQKELDALYKWRAIVNAKLTKMEWERDMVINNAIVKALEKFEADGIGQLDYAASYAGGSIMSLSKETRPYPTNESSTFLGIFNLGAFSSPEELIRPNLLPGSCFAFRGNSGAIRIKLGKPTVIGSVTLSHISKALSEDIGSTPKEFEVFASTEADEAEQTWSYLGKFTYDLMGGQHQTFQIRKSVPRDKIFRIVELRILSNYGKSEFTCVYRFRVHRAPL